MRRFLLAATLFSLIGMTAAVVAAGFGGIPLLGGAVPPQLSAAGANSGSKVAVFNMAAVMKEYGKAKYQVYLLNEERKGPLADLAALKAKCEKTKQTIEMEQNTKRKSELQDEEVELKREIEDKDRKINKFTNDKASTIVSTLYDEIKEEVDKMAEQNGYDIVFAYPDGRSPEELKSAYVKELKLKPPAAQPFFVAKRIDLTDAVIKALNTRNPAPPVPEGTQFPPMSIPMR
jgi:Skp family chaperone for outer membrane proteins